MWNFGADLTFGSRGYSPRRRTVEGCDAKWAVGESTASQIKGANLSARNFSARRFGVQRRRRQAYALLLSVLLMGGIGQTAAFAVDGIEGETGDRVIADAPTVDPGAGGASEQDSKSPDTASPTEAPESPVAPAPEDEESPAAGAAGGQSEIAPLKRQAAPAAPAVGQNIAKISVSVADMRLNSQGDRSALEGVTLRLYGNVKSGEWWVINNSPSPNPLEDAWASCVSNAQGICEFNVPDTHKKGSNRDERFWVAIDSVPEGWYANQKLEVGGAADSYMFLTGDRLRDGKTYKSGSDFMISDGSRTSAGKLVVSRSNPSIDIGCKTGVKVAIVLDLSASIGGNLSDLKTSAKRMVDSLKGTGSSVALFTFGTYAPMSSGAEGRNYPLVQVDQGSNASLLKAAIDGYGLGSSSGSGGTNWDEGIYAVAKANEGFDLAVVVTDGLPTFSGPNADGPGNSTRFREVEQAITSANAVKNQGTRMLAVGVGSGISGGAKNLSAISGPNAYQAGASLNNVDYFQADWKSLETMLEGIALGATCQANVDVSKLTLAYGTKTPVSGGSGWAFNATASGATLKPGADRTTNEQGKTSYQVEFASPTAQPAQVSLKETMSEAQKSAGWSLESVSCSVNGGSSQPYKELTANLQVRPGDQVSCEFTNVQRMVPGITIEKRAWDTTDPSKIKGAKQLVDGASVTSGHNVSWSYLVTNTGQTTLTGITVTDDKVSGVNCPGTTLQAGKSMTCTATGPVTAQ